MKYQFSKVVEFVPEWNDNHKLEKAEQVSMSLNVLSMGDVLLLMDTLEQDPSQKKGNVESENLDMSTTSALVEHAIVLLPKYVENFANLEGPDGPISTEEICKYPQFIGLIVEILFQLISISTPSEADTKN